MGCPFPGVLSPCAVQDPVQALFKDESSLAEAGSVVAFQRRHAKPGTTHLEVPAHIHVHIRIPYTVYIYIYTYIHIHIRIDMYNIHVHIHLHILTR